MSSSDSDDFEKFLHSVRTPKCKKPYRLSTGSLDDFIVNSSEEGVIQDSLKYNRNHSSCSEADPDILKGIKSLSLDNQEKSFSLQLDSSQEDKENATESSENIDTLSSNGSHAQPLEEKETSFYEQESSFLSFCEDLHESKEDIVKPLISSNLEGTKQELSSSDTNRADISCSEANPDILKGIESLSLDTQENRFSLNLDSSEEDKENVSESSEVTFNSDKSHSHNLEGKETSVYGQESSFSSFCEDLNEGKENRRKPLIGSNLECPKHELNSSDSIDISSDKPSNKGQTTSPRHKKSVLTQLSSNQPSLSEKNLSEKTKASPWTPLKNSPFGKGKSVSTPFKKVVFSSDSEEEVFKGNNSVATASTRFTFSDSADSVDNFDKPVEKPLLLLSSDSDEYPPSLSSRLKPQLKHFDSKGKTPLKLGKKAFLILSSDSEEEAPSLSTRLKPNNSDIRKGLSLEGISSLTDKTNVFRDKKPQPDCPSRASTENFFTPKHKPLVKYPATEKHNRSKMHCSVKGCFLTSLDLPVPKNKGKPFQRIKSEITSDLFKLFNSSVFDDQLPKDMEVTWAKRLTKTAGITRCQRVTKSLSGPDDNIILSRSYVASISLSDKVIDSACRLRDTLIHEMCHAAVWLLNNTNEGHGPFWKSWAARARRSHPELPMIERCHNYDIAYKYMYRCTKCQSEIGRHSKSIDTDKKVCGRCRGRLSLVTKGIQPDGTPAKPRRANPFANFVKSNYKDTRLRMESTSSVVSHREIMKSLSDQFRTVSLS